MEYKLLFDLNYKFELIGASLLALAKSIHLPVPRGQGAVPSEYITYPLIQGTCKQPSIIYSALHCLYSQLSILS